MTVWQIGCSQQRIISHFSLNGESPFLLFELLGSLHIYKETYFYRSTFILCIFFLLYIQIQRYTREALKRLRLNSISSVSS